jgi:hypothetical protein
MNDTDMINVARRLGATAAERLDVDAIARRVVERLREQPVQRPTWIRVQWLRIAAAFVLLIGGAVAVHEIIPVREGIGHPAHFVADDLNGLSTDELQRVLDRFDDLVSGTSTAVPESGGGDLHELDAQQLQRVLRSLEG